MEKFGSLETEKKNPYIWNLRIIPKMRPESKNVYRNWYFYICVINLKMYIVDEIINS